MAAPSELAEPDRRHRTDGSDPADRSQPIDGTDSASGRLADAIARAAEALLAAQRPDGVICTDVDWRSTVASAGALLTLHFARPTATEQLTRGAGWLRSVQGADGGWATVAGLDSQVVPTVLATAALAVTSDGSPATREAVQAGRAWFDRYGGFAALPTVMMGEICKFYYALAGWIPAADLRRIPLVTFASRRFSQRRANFMLPVVAALSLGQHAAASRRGPLWWAPQRWITPKAEGMIREIFDHEGGTGELGGDPWPAGLICLGLFQAGLAGDIVQASADHLLATVNADGSWNMMPIDITWTGFAVEGLIEAGYDDDPRLLASAQMLRSRQQAAPFPVLASPPGYWSYATDHGWPMTLESAQATAILARMPGGRQDPNVGTAVGWLLQNQDRAGSWGLCIPNATTPNISADPYTSARCIDALFAAGPTPDRRRIARAIRWLEQKQLPDGSFEAMWYRDHTCGTAMVLIALCQAGRTHSAAARRARDRLLDTQRDDGSWGTGVAGTPGSAEETAWALRALLVAGVPAAEAAIGAAVTWLLDRQLPDGQWPTTAVSWWIRHCYSFFNATLTTGLVLQALGAYRTAVGPALDRWPT